MYKIVIVSIVLALVSIIVVSVPYVGIDVNGVKDISIKALYVIGIMSAINFFIIRGL